MDLHHYAISTHPDELVPEPLPKKMLDPPMTNNAFHVHVTAKASFGKVIFI